MQEHIRTGDFSTGDKFCLVSNFTELQDPTQVTQSYALLLHVYSINYPICLLTTYLVYSVNYHVCLLITTRTNQSGEYNR